MAERPDNWKAEKPHPYVCIYCYDVADRVFLWKYGVHYVDLKCVWRAKQSIGFVAIFAHIAAAEARRRAILEEEATKKTKGSARGRGVDSRSASVRTKDHRR